MLQDLVLSLARRLESPKEDDVAEVEQQHPYNTLHRQAQGKRY